MMNVALLATVRLLLVAIIRRYITLRVMMIRYLFLPQLSSQNVRGRPDGLIVPERDGPAIAEAIRSVAKERVIRARMSKAALATAGGHALGVFGDRHYAILAELARQDG